MKRNILLILSIVLSGAIYAQNETDALRYSYLTHGGSSRYQAMGGALGGLGADYSAAATNPGALGRFSRHKFALSLDNNVTTTNTTYNGSENKMNSNKFTISHLSAIFAKDMISKSHKWQYVQFGLGYNRTTNFHTSIKSEGINNTSLVNLFANDGFGIQPADLLDLRAYTTNLAWESYAVDYDAATGVYTPRFSDQPMIHDRTIERFGGVGEYSASVAANYDNKLYLGVSINAHRINFEERVQHNENIIDTAGGLLLSSHYTFNLKTNGTGINAKIGVVYLPYDWLRIGVAFHTPTRTHLTDQWDADMYTVQKNGSGGTQVFETDSEFKPSGRYRYYMISPLRGILSVGLILKSRFALGIEAEYVNYGWARLRSTSDIENYEAYNFSDENDEIRNQLGSGFNVRLGGEFLINNEWTARLGYSFYSSPYKSSVGNNNFPTMFVSGGIGYKIKGFGIDLTYSAMIAKEDYFGFDPSEASNLSQIDRLDHRINLGLSYAFR